MSDKALIRRETSTLEISYIPGHAVSYILKVDEDGEATYQEVSVDGSILSNVCNNEDSGPVVIRRIADELHLILEYIDGQRINNPKDKKIIGTIRKRVKKSMEALTPHDK